MLGRGSMVIRARLGLLGSTSTTVSTRALLSSARLTSSVTMLSGVASSASAARVPLSISCVEIDQAEAGDRGQEEQDLGRHHRGDHQPQDAQRQAEGGISATQGADQFGRRGDIGGHCRSLSESALPA